MQVEHIKIDGDRLIAEVKRLVAEGNVRRISIKQGEHTVAEFPLTVGVAGNRLKYSSRGASARHTAQATRGLRP